MTKANKSLDEFYPHVLSKEPSVRLECFSSLENYLSDRNTSIDCEDLSGFINAVLKWVEGSNYRVRSPLITHHQPSFPCQISYNGLRLLELFTERLDAYKFENHLDSGTERSGQHVLL